MASSSKTKPSSSSRPSSSSSKHRSGSGSGKHGSGSGSGKHGSGSGSGKHGSGSGNGADKSRRSSHSRDGKPSGSSSHHHRTSSSSSLNKDAAAAPRQPSSNTAAAMPPAKSTTPSTTAPRTGAPVTAPKPAGATQRAPATNTTPSSTAKPAAASPGTATRPALAHGATAPGAAGPNAVRAAPAATPSSMAARPANGMGAAPMSNIHPNGGSMMGGMYGPNGNPSGYGGMGGMGGMGGNYGSGYGSMGGVGAQNALGGYGSMGGGMMTGYGSMGPGGMGSGYGSMGGGQEGMGGFGSIYGSHQGMGSMYGGGMGSAYGSMYGMNPMMMGSMYGMNPMMMGSMYGMNPMMMGSMYGMNPMMGSMYGGVGGGSMYNCSYHSVVDAASRRDDFLNRNELIRADVKPLNNGSGKKAAEKDDEKTTKDGEKTTPGKFRTLTAPAAKAEEKKDADKKDVKEGEKDTEKSKEAVAKKTRPAAASGASDGDKKDDAKATKDDEKKEKEAEKKEKAAKETETKEDAKTTKEPEKKESEKKETDTGAKITGTHIRGLLLLLKSGKEAKLTTKDKNTVVLASAETKLDEVIVVEDPKKPVESLCLTEVRNQWVSGHNSTIMVASGPKQRQQALDFMSDYLSSCTGKLAASGEYFVIYVTMTAIRGAEQGCDLLKQDAGYETLALASSPVYGPALNNMTIKEVNTKDGMAACLKEGAERAKDEKELICCYLVLKQVRKVGSAEMVYLSSLNVTIAGPYTEHLTGLKEKKSEEPCRLYRYSVGGGSHAVCIGIVNDDEADAGKLIEAVKAMNGVENTEPRSGNVKRFVEYTKKEIPRCKSKISDTAEESKKANYETMLKRMEMMLKDAEDLEKDPKTTAPKAYV
ncbi:hypothetical protein ABL78_2820 [Leptomonas seymouri]|uniref:Uncharacterized protein n=1 Tax=Leptomonas seymouri TaxID=5684 RepID=A0A0N1I0D6_LEPSE|nr:hypothetical protein ABL78_2820 [Leptomonas seymouri]|eukprot:KPI88090.1 hypothetical protein ABL78_2820 [Leptomonas seymouri]